MNFSYADYESTLYYAQADKQTVTGTRLNTDIHAHLNTAIRTRLNTDIHTRLNTDTHTYTHVNGSVHDILWYGINYDNI